MSAESEKGQRAEEVVDRWVSFQTALSDKREFPTREFTAFATSVREYVRVVGRDPLIHREVLARSTVLLIF